MSGLGGFGGKRFPFPFEKQMIEFGIAFKSHIPIALRV